jgi:hypothetical protein
MTGPYGWQAVEWWKTTKPDGTPAAACRPVPVLGWVLRWNEVIEETQARPVVAIDRDSDGGWDGGFMVNAEGGDILGYLAPGSEFVAAKWFSLAKQAMQDREEQQDSDVA